MRISTLVHVVLFIVITLMVGNGVYSTYNNLIKLGITWLTVIRTILQVISVVVYVLCIFYIYKFNTKKITSDYGVLDYFPEDKSHKE